VRTNEGRESTERATVSMGDGRNKDDDDQHLILNRAHYLERDPSPSN
jgi:hypothetical protein